jgi:archaellum biogenesis protein FlaJ (TadC family)
MQGIPVAVLAVFFMIFMTIVFLFPSTPQTSIQQMNYTVVVLGGVLLLSLIWYYFPKYGGVHWFTGPVPNVNIRTSSPQSINSEKGDEKVDVDQVA